jgi:hypothetical protein
MNVLTDIIDRILAEECLKESEAGEAFLLKVSDTATPGLGRHLPSSHVHDADVLPTNHPPPPQIPALSSRPIPGDFVHRMAAYVILGVEKSGAPPECRKVDCVIRNGAL